MTVDSSFRLQISSREFTLKFSGTVLSAQWLSVSYLDCGLLAEDFIMSHPWGKKCPWSTTQTPLPKCFLNLILMYCKSINLNIPLLSWTLSLLSLDKLVSLPNQSLPTAIKITMNTNIWSTMPNLKQKDPQAELQFLRWLACIISFLNRSRP